MKPEELLACVEAMTDEQKERMAALLGEAFFNLPLPMITACYDPEPDPDVEAVRRQVLETLRRERAQPILTHKSGIGPVQKVELPVGCYEFDPAMLAGCALQIRNSWSRDWSSDHAVTVTGIVPQEAFSLPAYSTRPDGIQVDGPVRGFAVTQITGPLRGERPAGLPPEAKRVADRPSSLLLVPEDLRPDLQARLPELGLTFQPGDFTGVRFYEVPGTWYAIDTSLAPVGRAVGKSTTLLQLSCQTRLFDESGRERLFLRVGSSDPDEPDTLALYDPEAPLF